MLPPNTPEKPSGPTKPHAGPPTSQLTQVPVQPASVGAVSAQSVLPATGAPASLWLVLLGAGLVLGGVVLTRRSSPDRTRTTCRARRIHPAGPVLLGHSRRACMRYRRIGDDPQVCPELPGRGRGRNS